jgi:hypothetical protein
VKSSEILIKARNLIADPKKWFGGDPDGEHQWGGGKHCALTSVCVASDNAANNVRDAIKKREEALEYLRQLTPAYAIPKHNDDHQTTHANVMAWFDWAIGMAEAEGQ